MTDNENSNTFECSVEGCGEHDMGTSGQPYGWCQCCEEFLICDKQDAEHSASMLYWEECHDHHTGGYSVCIKCALGAFKDLKETLGEEVVPGEEHCICPECKHDFGLLNELTSTNEKKFICSINGYHEDTSEYGKHKHDNNMPYGWCAHCCEFAICGKQDAEHSASMLYWEECRAHHPGGYSVCIKCAIGAFKDHNGEGEEHCICPECKHDYGLLTDLTP